MITVGELRKRLALLGEDCDGLPVTYGSIYGLTHPIEDAGHSLSRVPHEDGSLGNYAPAEFVILVPREIAAAGR